MANRSTHEWHCSPPSDQISSDTARKLTTDDDQLANEQMQNAIESSGSLGQKLGDTHKLPFGQFYGIEWTTVATVYECPHDHPNLVGRSSKAGDIQSSITWNAVIMESVQSSYVKRLDLETYFSLNLPSARQAYRFLDKRFYK